MLSIRSSADLARALEGLMEPALRSLLALRRDQLLAGGGADLGDLAHIIVVRPYDSLAAVEAEAGFPLIGEEAPFEWVLRHPHGILEAAVVTDDDGFAVAIFARDCVTTDAALLVALLSAADC